MFYKTSIKMNFTIFIICIKKECSNKSFNCPCRGCIILSLRIIVLYNSSDENDKYIYIVLHSILKISTMIIVLLIFCFMSDQRTL